MRSSTAIATAIATLFLCAPSWAESSMPSACPPGMSLMIKPSTGTRYCVGIHKEPLLSNTPRLERERDQGSAGHASTQPSTRGRDGSERARDFRNQHQEWKPDSASASPSDNGMIATQPTSCQPGFELRAPHMLATTSECLPIRCRDSEILEGGQCFLNGHSPTQLAALNQRMDASPDPQLYCPADSTMVLHSAGYTWLCKPNNAYAFSGESQWPAAKNRVFEQIQQANAGLGAGRGCSAQVDWRDAKEPSRGFCRIELGVGFPLDDSGNIKNGYAGLITRYNEGSTGSVNATCVDGVWQLSNAVCNSTSNTYGHNDGTGKVVMDVGFSDAQTKLNAEIEAQRKANEAAVYAAEAAKNLAVQKASRAPLIAENLAIARDTTKEINERIHAYNDAHIMIGDGKQVGGMGPQCESAILASQKSEGEIITAQRAIINDPHASAGAKGAAADRILSVYSSSQSAGGSLKGNLKSICDSEMNQLLAN